MENFPDPNQLDQWYTYWEERQQFAQCKVDRAIKEIKRLALIDQMVLFEAPAPIVTSYSEFYR